MNRFLTMMAATAALCWAVTAAAGDPAAGEAIYDEQCADCHEPDDFEGESAADIAALISSEDTASVHKKKADISKLSAEDVANIAAFFAK
ncbi:MAG: c-type cytochrome [Gammaproteobacteria bacterium]|jgi:mono/diheme cytochrome c family protein